MNIDVMVARLIRNGFSENKAEEYAVILKNLAKSYGVNPLDFIDDIQPSTFKLNDLGKFVTNSALRQGYITGSIKNKQPNKYVARTIINE